MRRKAGTLIPIEIAILKVAVDLQKRGTREIHGYELAKRIQVDADRKLLTSHGTLYRALHRLEDLGLIESLWEDAALSEAEGRPRRRLYRATAATAPALAKARAESATTGSPRNLKPRWGT